MTIALVTGGSRGIGKATALLLAQEGYTVVVNYHQNSAAATDVVNEIRACGGNAVALRADVSDEAQVMEMFAAIDRLGEPLSALVNNAGITQPLKLMDIKRANYDAVLDVSLRGTLLMSQAVIPTMRAQSGYPAA